MSEKQEALDYHVMGRPGKIEVVATKPLNTAIDLRLAYSPGVAEPCKVIHEEPEAAFKYTARGNLVAVITNGTAVLGLGDIGPLAGKPVMEGKGVLFKKFADIDVFDIEIDEKDPDKLIDIIKSLGPTFGGINLEDIKAPECFYIEKRLAAEMDIPIFHDDQHGTAIISGAALLNALELNGKKIEDVKVVCNGAGASALACLRFFFRLGVKEENALVCDSRGVLTKEREESVNDTKKPFCRDTDKKSLAEAMEGSDIFLGLSVGNVVSRDMVKKMAKDPIIFALANPTPEIAYPDAREARPDAIVATGRSDYPNQVNNVLGFPFIFRGALDTRARVINEEMKVAAARAIAQLAKEEVPDSVSRAYGNQRFSFGPDYIIPKPFDPRVLTFVAPAVAEAATESGVARDPLGDVKEYRESLERRFNPARNALHLIYRRARQNRVRLVLPEGDDARVMQAARIMDHEGIAHPILLGHRSEILRKIEELNLEFDHEPEIIEPEHQADYNDAAHHYYALRQRKGITESEARRVFKSRNYYGCVMVQTGRADGLLTGVTRAYPHAVRPILEILGTREKRRAFGMYMLAFKNSVKFLCDTTMTIDPTAEDMAAMAIATAERVRRDFGVEPRIAMLSFSNFGSTPHPSSVKAARAVQLVHERRPDLQIDGEMQADTALDSDKRLSNFPFTTLKNDANVLIFGDLASANISYKLLHKLAQCTAVGPILLGLNRAANVCQISSSVKEIVDMAAITAAHARDLAESVEPIELRPAPAQAASAE
jgi:malate dehydrogenase (oxaloacetate-decarboxylating)(NADP+)